MTTSRLALEEASNRRPIIGELPPEVEDLTFAYADLAQAILDAPPVEWCRVHESNGPHNKSRCWYAVTKMQDLTGDSPAHCQFATYVRVKVGP